MILVVPPWFVKRRALAMGIASSGLGAGYVLRHYALKRDELCLHYVLKGHCLVVYLQSMYRKPWVPVDTSHLSIHYDSYHGNCNPHYTKPSCFAESIKDWQLEDSVPDI